MTSFYRGCRVSRRAAAIALPPVFIDARFDAVDGLAVRVVVRAAGGVPAIGLASQARMVRRFAGDRSRVTGIEFGSFMVPAQFIAVLQVADAPVNAPHLQTLLCAGSPLRRDTKREVVTRFGDKLIELYGYSEGFATMLKPGAPADKFHTVGTPVLGFEVRILDDAGQVLPAGIPGEIAGYGAGMMSRYHGKPEATEALIWRDERGRRFIRSGDIGKLDDDGYLVVLVDRKKDMIISGGFNVFPADLEEVVGQHAAVMDVTVIGIPHERWGETPLALVIPRPGVALDSAAVMAWSNERLGKHQRISGVELRDEFPRNALGKVLKRLLREAYWSKNQDGKA